jgi:nucleotide-binding universal stress UspA family protein
MEASMTYKDILVYLDGSPDNEGRLDVAIALARTYEARLTGVDVSTEAAFESQWAERATGLAALFDDKARQAHVAHHFKLADRAAASWKALYAHYADLLIATQPNPAASGLVLSAVPEDVLMSAGVPVLLLPVQWRPRPVGQNVVIAWSPSREATRAFHDSLPFLERAQQVTVFAFDSPSDVNDADLDLFRDHLQAHDIRVEIDRWFNTGEISAVEALYASRGMEDADLVVAGAYSHSRALESLFGGMTRQLLQSTTPVLLSH